ncbi:MAG TPA: hypothetical protein V6C85_31045, partial [Allocoleopsis sp.]
ETGRWGHGETGRRGDGETGRCSSLSNPYDLLQHVCIASIGPQTSVTCRELLGRVDVEAQEYTLEGLTQAIVQWATDKA